jgi:hypothetical protein
MDSDAGFEKDLVTMTKHKVYKTKFNDEKGLFLFLLTLQEGLPSSMKSLQVWTNKQCCRIRTRTGTAGTVTFCLSGTGTY